MNYYRWSDGRLFRHNTDTDTVDVFSINDFQWKESWHPADGWPCIGMHPQYLIESGKRVTEEEINSFFSRMRHYGVNL